MGKRYQIRDGLVIRRSALPSGDVIVTLLSDDGKWRAIARKGKLPGGNLGRLSLFHDVTVQYYRRREEDLALLVQVQLNGALPGLSAPDVYPYAHLLAELADGLTVDVHVGENLHAYLASGLRGLSRHEDPERVALVYAWKLLQAAGLSPRARGCGACGAEAPLTHLDLQGGALVCAGCGVGVRLGEEAGAELAALLTGTAREAMALSLAERPLHWRALSRYVSYHVAELRSLASLAPSRPEPVRV